MHKCHSGKMCKESIKQPANDVQLLKEVNMKTVTEKPRGSIGKCSPHSVLWKNKPHLYIHYSHNLQTCITMKEGYKGTRTMKNITAG